MSSRDTALPVAPVLERPAATAAPVVRHRLKEIDVLRGLAAVWVMFSHYGPHWNDRLEPATVIIPNGFGIYAVKLFFVISGFVIFMTLEKCRTVTDFAVLRFSRLYPTYWAGLILVTLISIVVFGDTFWPGGFLSNLTMFQEFLGFPHDDNVYWSLTVELAFYLNVAWLLAFGVHHNVTRIVIAWLACSVVWSFFIEDRDLAHRDWFARLFALDFAPYFAMGIVFFAASKEGWSRTRAALIALSIATELVLNGWIGLCVALVVATIFLLAISGRLSFMVTSVTLWLGGISFPLYLVHRNLGYKSLDWLHANGVDALIAQPLVMLGALAFATLLSYGIERPALTLIRNAYLWGLRKVRLSNTP